MKKKIRVSMVGCCLVDRLYNNISFSSPAFRQFISKKPGDGGLMPGKLVFREEFEAFCKAEPDVFVRKVSGKIIPDKINIGGPGIVPLIHIRQMLSATDVECHFYGCGGDDADGAFITSVLSQTGIPDLHYKLFPGQITPSTIVLSDPGFDKGNGERMFINTIGSAWNYTPEMPGDSFFSTEVAMFGGTALVPMIHDNLGGMLIQAKSKGCITIVNTVYDFRNEFLNPAARWPMGKNDEGYKYIDLLIADFEEAMRLSGKDSMDRAMHFFREKGLNAILVTNGAENVLGYASGNSLFKPINHISLPVSEAVSGKLRYDNQGDTTGCGDNFSGGVAASLVAQLQSGTAPPDLTEACMWGVVSGGFACFYVGGTFNEKYPGEKLSLVKPYYELYKKQVGKGG